MTSSGGRVDLDGKAIKGMTICMIGAGGFIGSHLCEKIMGETEHKILAVDVYSDKIKHLLDDAADILSPILHRTVTYGGDEISSLSICSWW